MSRLTLHLLGQVSIRRGQKPLAGLPSRKAEALLIYLACTRRPAAREVLADLLWDDRPQDQALANLRTLLSGLRRALGQALVVNRDSIAFNHKSDYWLDVEAFEQQIADSRLLMADEPSATGNPPSAIGHLQSASDLYRGDFLAGFHLRQSRGFEEWATLERERLHRLAATALSRLAWRALDGGDYARGLDFAARLLQLDPLSEDAHRQRMLLLARSGQRSAALAQYETCRRLLADELGAAPTEATTALYARLKSARTLGAHNLPPPATAFIGREDEVSALRRQLANPNCRLLTLLGLGGIGKTRLALETARQIVERQAGMFLHGVCFAALSSVGAARFLAPALVEALNVPGSGEPEERLFNYLGEKELLLVLDSFEHLLPSAHMGDERESGSEGIDLLADLLQRAPLVKLLVTSRERLNLREEWVFDVPGLTLPPLGLLRPAIPEPRPGRGSRDEAGAGEDAPGALEAYSAAHLFVAEARRARRDFAPSPDEAGAIARVCRMLEGVPLGIELAASAVREQTCAALAEALAHGLDVLASPLRNVPERHRSLRAAFDHSWSLLSTAEREAARQLSVFRGAFTGEAAEHVAGVSAARLSALADKSFLRLAASRYEMHDILRQYAAEQFSPAEQRAVNDAHCRYYADYLEGRAAWLRAGRKQPALQEIGAELDNVRAAWEWAVAHRLGLPLGQMLDSLGFFYVTRGWVREGREAFRRAIEALAGESTPDAVLIARLQTRQADCETDLSNFDAARTLLEASTTTFRARNAWSPLAWAYDVWGILAYNQGRYAEARQYVHESLALFRQLDERPGIAQALNNLANILCDESAAYTEADHLYQESLALYEQLGDAFGQAKCLINMGSTAQMRNEYERARDLHQQGVALCRASDNRAALAIALTNLGQTLSKIGQYTEAERWLLESLKLKREFGNRRSIVFALNLLGTVTTRTGRYQEAKDYYDEALMISRQLASPTLSADVLIGAASLLNARGQAERALEVLAAVQRHAGNDSEILNNAAGQWAEIAGRVPPEVAEACRARGQRRALDDVVAEWLSEPMPLTPGPALTSTSAS
jgi:DNA-binding SARP family transcriptional activator